LARLSVHTYWPEVIAIIEAGLKPDPRRVSAYATHLAGRLEEEGEPRLGERIRRLAERAARPAGATYRTMNMPTDIEAHLDLVEEREPNSNALYPILPDDVLRELQRFVELRGRAGELERRGIRPPSALLLYGAPGCGKTIAAANSTS